MQIGIVLDNGEKYTNEEVLTSARFPIGFIGFRKFIVPDERRIEYWRKKILTATVLMKYLRLSYAPNVVIDGGCVAQPFFEYNLPLYFHPSSLMSMLQGKLMHEALQPQRSTVHKEMQVKGKLFGYEVVGDIDFYDEERGIVYDLKTHKTLYRVPHPFDVVQTYIYAKLLEQNGYPVKSSTLAYLSHNQLLFMKFMKERYDATFTFSDIERLLTLREPVNIERPVHYDEPVGYTLGYDYSTKKDVSKEANWRCAYCPYRRYCPYAKENMLKYITDISRLSNFSMIVGKYAEIRGAGVKEGDEFMYPEDELYDVFAEVYGSRTDYVVNAIKERRKVIKTSVKPAAIMEW